MTTNVSLDIDAQYLDVFQRKITIYGDVKPPSPANRAIDCRTCTQAGWGNCMLKPGECSSGSRYVAAPVLRFWRQS